MQQTDNQCPLCRSDVLVEFAEDNQRAYRQCKNCQLVNVAAEYHLSAAQEKSEYDKHQNDPADPGYRRFLSRVVTPLSKRLQTSAQGLDFGCGPGPAISQMMAEHGYQVTNYDLYYYPQASALSRQYDFITMTEVIEHLANPIAVLQQLNRLLKTSGILAVMTKRVQSREAFAQWHYKNDPTHINFYSESTFQWVGRKFGWNLEIIDKDVVFFTKE